MKQIVTASLLIGCFGLAACESSEDRAVLNSGSFAGEVAGEACARGVMNFMPGEDRASVVHVERDKACNAVVSVPAPNIPVGLKVVEQPQTGTVQTVSQVVTVADGARKGLKWIYTPRDGYVGEDKFVIVYQQRVGGELKESRLTYFVKVQ
jgi:hypothetical protein